MALLAAVNGWWALARASGLAAWFFVVASLVLGALAAGRMVPAKGATRWLLDLHPWISTLGLALVVLHVVALLNDSFVSFDPFAVLVPFASPWRTLAVTWGVVALWGLLAVEATSLVRRWMPKRSWHAVHLLSYGVAVLITVHALTAGSDVTSAPVRIVLVGTAFLALVVSGLRARQAAIAADARAAEEEAASAAQAQERARTATSVVPGSVVGTWPPAERTPVVVGPSRPPVPAATPPTGWPAGPPTAPPATAPRVMPAAPNDPGRDA
jgi:DMSO/TMAO reductase YedYZ heme-binding membrane subunit